MTTEPISFPAPTAAWGEPEMIIGPFDAEAPEPPRHASGWPQRVIDALGRPPQVGDWYAECCELDLRCIDGEEDLDDLWHLYFDFDTGGSWFRTEAQARAGLADWDPHGLKRIAPPQRSWLVRLIEWLRKPL